MRRPSPTRRTFSRPPSCCARVKGSGLERRDLDLPEVAVDPARLDEEVRRRPSRRAARARAGQARVARARRRRGTRPRRRRRESSSVSPLGNGISATSNPLRAHSPEVAVLARRPWRCTVGSRCCSIASASGDRSSSPLSLADDQVAVRERRELDSVAARRPAPGPRQPRPTSSIREPPVLLRRQPAAGTAAAAARGPAPALARSTRRRADDYAGRAPPRAGAARSASPSCAGRAPLALGDLRLDRVRDSSTSSTCLRPLDALVVRSSTWRTSLSASSSIAAFMSVARLARAQRAALEVDGRLGDLRVGDRRVLLDGELELDLGRGRAPGGRASGASARRSFGWSRSPRGSCP